MGGFTEILLQTSCYLLALEPSLLPHLQVGFIADHGLLSIHWRHLVLIKQEPQILQKDKQKAKKTTT